MTQSELYKKFFNYLCKYYNIPFKNLRDNYIVLGIQTNGFKLTDKVCSVSVLHKEEGKIIDDYTEFIRPRIGVHDDEEDIYDRIADLEDKLGDHIDFTLTVDNVRNGRPARSVGKELSELLAEAEKKSLPVVAFSMFNFGWPRLRQILTRPWRSIESCPNLFDLGMMAKEINICDAYGVDLDLMPTPDLTYEDINKNGLRVKWSLIPCCTEKFGLIQPGETKLEHKYTLCDRFYNCLLDSFCS